MKNNHQIIKKEQSIYSLIKSTSLKYPRRIALRYLNHKYTYTHFLKRINQFSTGLISLGVKENDPVTICLPNIPDAVYLLYAINQIGAIANIVHPLFSIDQLKENIELTGSKYVFCLDTKYNGFKELSDKITLVSCSPTNELTLLEKCVYSNSNKQKLPKEVKYTSKSFYKLDRCELDNPLYKNDAIYLHSGGTSGKPKTIALSSFAVNALADDIPWIVQKDDFKNFSMLAVLPMFHGFGLVVGVHSMLCLGGTDVLMPKFKTKDTIRYISRKQLSVIIGIPVLYESLLTCKNFRGKKVRNLHSSYVGGDFVSSSLLERFNGRMERSNSKCRLYQGYGLTECVNITTVNTFFSNKPSTVGNVVPNLKCKIIDPETLKPLSFEKEGEICFTGETLMNGYRFNDDPEIDNKTFVEIDGEKYLRTGDFGYLDEDNFITFRTRIKRLIKVNGVPVFPSMIEDAAISYNFVYEAAAVGVEDEKRGHIIKLFIVLNRTYKGTKEEALNKINERIMSRLGVYSKPKEIIFLDRMPRTPLGKIDFKNLK